MPTEETHALGFPRPEDQLMCYFGNIWIRPNHLPFAGDSIQGHKHNFDHVTFLFRGRVMCEVDGYEPKEFVAPCIIPIRKDYMHKFTALENETVYYCVFAVRNTEGEVFDPMVDSVMDPLAHMAQPK